MLARLTAPLASLLLVLTLAGCQEPDSGGGPGWNAGTPADCDGRLERVSLAPSGAQANGASTHPRLSTDGRFLAFESEASNLVAGDTNGQRDVFLLDLEARQVRRVSLGSGGAEANGASTQARLSEDGGG